MLSIRFLWEFALFFFSPQNQHFSIQFLYSKFSPFFQKENPDFLSPEISGIGSPNASNYMPWTELNWTDDVQPVCQVRFVFANVRGNVEMHWWEIKKKLKNPVLHSTAALLEEVKFKDAVGEILPLARCLCKILKSLKLTSHDQQSNHRIYSCSSRSMCYWFVIIYVSPTS